LAKNNVNIFYSEIYPNWDFWFENLPSGSTAPPDTKPSIKNGFPAHKIDLKAALQMNESDAILTPRVMPDFSWYM
jgi:hypothetical protein